MGTAAGRLKKASVFVRSDYAMYGKAGGENGSENLRGYVIIGTGKPNWVSLQPEGTGQDIGP